MQTLWDWWREYGVYVACAMSGAGLVSQIVLYYLTERRRLEARSMLALAESNNKEALERLNANVAAVIYTLRVYKAAAEGRPLPEPPAEIADKLPRTLH